MCLFAEKIDIEKIIPELKNLIPSELDRGFLSRVYNTDQNIYLNRLKAIDFLGKQTVLDAACGFGQWSFAMAKLNNKVHAFDFSNERIEICKKINNEIYKKNNIEFKTGNLENLDYPDNMFDTVFCYSAVFFVDYNKAFSEFNRVLKPGGKLYICANSWGWYIYNIIKAPNANKDFSPRKNAIKAMIETIRFPLTGKRNVGTQIIMYPAKINKILQKTGFKNNILFDGDGKINLTGTKEVKNFYPKTKYKMTNVYEFVCEKKNLVLVLLRTLLGEKTIETFTYLEPITNFI